jgi:hypothetical protein
MDRTAQDIHNQYHGKLVTIKKTNEETVIGIIMLAAGLEKAGNLVPNTSFIQVDVINDLAAYKKRFETEQQYILIHPDDIESISQYDFSDIPVNMSYTDFQNVASGINPTYLFEVIDKVKNGKQFNVHHEGAWYKIVILNEEELGLERIA